MSERSTRPQMDAWRRRFTFMVIGVAFISQLPLAISSWFLLLPEQLANRWLVIVVAALLFVVVANAALVQRLREWRDHQRRAWTKIWLIEAPYFVLFGSAWFWVLAIVPTLLLWALVDRTTSIHWSGRDVVAGLTACSYLAGNYGVFVRRWWTPISTVECKIAGLDPALDGLVIAQLSDLHCGPNMPRWFLRHLATRASSIGADIITMTGDFITEGEGYLDDVTYVADTAKAPLGVYCCLGNHDYFGTTEGVADAIKKSKAKLLRNDGITLERDNGAKFYIAGVDDTWTKRDSIASALKNCPDGAPAVLLAHDPLLFPAAQAEGAVKLVLSGHTHGGQLSFPFLSKITNLARVRFAQSLGVYFNDTRKSALYVHPGNGTTGPPIRFGVAPVIARIVLRRG